MANTLNDFEKMIDTIHIYNNMMMIQTQIIRHQVHNKMIFRKF
jgi:hypothetical protein